MITEIDSKHIDVLSLTEFLTLADKIYHPSLREGSLSLRRKISVSFQQWATIHCEAVNVEPCASNRHVADPESSLKSCGQSSTMGHIKRNLSISVVENSGKTGSILTLNPVPKIISPSKRCQYFYCTLT